MHVCTFEDRRVADLEPLTLTRPAFDLLCGQTTLAVKQFRFWHATRRTALVRPELAALVRQDHPDLAVNAPLTPAGETVVLVNARWLPPLSGSQGVPELLQAPCVGLIEDEVAFAVLPAERAARCTPGTVDEQLEEWKDTLPARPAGGRLVRYLWDLVAVNGEQITADWEWGGRKHLPVPALVASVVGPRSALVIDREAKIDPLVVADTTGGPVVIAQGATVGAFTRLEGPCFIGPGTVIHGAKIRAGTSVGPECRIGGEVEASVVLGHSNKYHDGFLGHAYIGAWVNLGAGTQNSDLRNDYGTVRVVVGGQLVCTGQTKVGCFLGDHTKAGLSTLLNTGTSVGAFCNLLPSGGFLPKYLPSFTSWWNSALREGDDLDGLLRTAGVVMARRGRVLTEAHQAVYRGLFESTTAERRRALREAEARRLRRTA